ncbi:hypothetical protein [Nocardia sp. NPDC057668]|uniref:hypothetical protein n=1 Tax=Nocardia sp. NPDC057668 TaxID=3346202 RepID=UPI00366B7427
MIPPELEVVGSVLRERGTLCAGAGSPGVLHDQYVLAIDCGTPAIRHDEPIVDQPVLYSAAGSRLEQELLQSVLWLVPVEYFKQAGAQTVTVLCIDRWLRWNWPDHRTLIDSLDLGYDALRCPVSGRMCQPETEFRVSPFD